MMLSTDKTAEIVEKPKFDLDELTTFYHKNLNSEAYYYLEKKGIQQDTADKFRLGFESGKIGFYIRENTLAEYFEDRIIVPIIQKDGVISDLVGKAVDHREHAYKSLLGVEDVLFNEPALAGTSEIIICSDIFDVLTLEQVKLPAVSMPNKQQFKESLADQFYGKRVFICLSNDETGHRESVRIESLLKEHAKEIFIVQLPEKIRDINDLFLKKEKPLDALRSILDRTIEETMKAPVSSDDKYSTLFKEEYLKRHQDPPAKYSTGLAGVDRLLAGGFGTGVYLLAGPSSSGKSMLFKQMADHISLHQHPVIFVTWDMTPFELWARSMARLLGISPQEVLYGQADPEEVGAANQNYTEIGKMQWTLECDSQSTPNEICGFIEKISVQAGKPPVVFIDALHRLVFSVDDDESGRDPRDLILFKIKQWAKEWNSAIVAALSLEDGQDALDAPVLAAADVILQLSEEDRQNHERKMSLKLLKNRHGELGKTGLQFTGNKAVFTENL